MSTREEVRSCPLVDGSDRGLALRLPCHTALAFVSRTTTNETRTETSLEAQLVRRRVVGVRPGWRQDPAVRRGALTIGLVPTAGSSRVSQKHHGGGRHWLLGHNQEA
jgi:hypothetical protein